MACALPPNHPDENGEYNNQDDDSNDDDSDYNDRKRKLFDGFSDGELPIRICRCPYNNRTKLPNQCTCGNNSVNESRIPIFPLGDLCRRFEHLLPELFLTTEQSSSSSSGNSSDRDSISQLRGMYLAEVLYNSSRAFLEQHSSGLPVTDDIPPGSGFWSLSTSSDVQEPPVQPERFATGSGLLRAAGYINWRQRMAIPEVRAVAGYVNPVVCASSSSDASSEAIPHVQASCNDDVSPEAIPPEEASCNVDASSEAIPPAQASSNGDASLGEIPPARASSNDVSFRAIPSAQVSSNGASLGAIPRTQASSRDASSGVIPPALASSNGDASLGEIPRTQASSNDVSFRAIPSVQVSSNGASLGAIPRTRASRSSASSGAIPRARIGSTESSSSVVEELAPLEDPIVPIISALPQRPIRRRRNRRIVGPEPDSIWVVHQKAGSNGSSDESLSRLDILGTLDSMFGQPEYEMEYIGGAKNMSLDELSLSSTRSRQNQPLVADAFSMPNLSSNGDADVSASETTASQNRERPFARHIESPRNNANITEDEMRNLDEMINFERYRYINNRYDNVRHRTRSEGDYADFVQRENLKNIILSAISAPELNVEKPLVIYDLYDF